MGFRREVPRVEETDDGFKIFYREAEADTSLLPTCPVSAYVEVGEGDPIVLCLHSWIVDV